MYWLWTRLFDQATLFSWLPNQNSILSPERLNIQFSDPKSFQITQQGSIRNFPRKLHLKTRVHTHSLAPEKFHKNISATRLFQKKLTHSTLFHTPNLHPYPLTPKTLLILTPPLLNIIHGLYQATFDSHTGRTVLVIKAGYHFCVQSHIQSWIQSCAGVKKILLTFQLTYPLLPSFCIHNLALVR